MEKKIEEAKKPRPEDEVKAESAQKKGQQEAFLPPELDPTALMQYRW